MNARKRAILNAIELAPRTASELASMTNAPQASVRRLVQSLRFDGHDISFAWPEDGGVYRYSVGSYEDAEMGTDDYDDTIDPAEGNRL